MATITHDHSFAGVARASGPSLRARMESWLERRRTIARVTRELETYSDRQLADLGLSRGDIPDVARGRLTR